MPIDLSCDHHDRLVLINNRAGVSLPFSSGVLATSVLATGVETPVAYGIAAEICGQLQRGVALEIDGDDLAERTALVIAARAGIDAAERYRAWRRAKRSGTPLVLCLSGAPGVGKSTVATRLAMRLGIDRIVPTDAIREVLRLVIPATVLPELHLPVHETGDGAAEAFVSQAGAVSAAAASVAGRMAEAGRSVMVEGSHLVPGAVRDALLARGTDAVVLELLLTLDDQGVHRSHLLRRARAEPAHAGARHLQHFGAIRALQDRLQVLAREAGVGRHDLAHPESLTQRVVDRVVAEIEGRELVVAEHQA